MLFVPVGSIRWTAREESLCCSFLQKQMQTSPNDKKDQLLAATSVYLVTEGYFRNPKRTYTHLWKELTETSMQHEMGYILGINIEPMHITLPDLAPTQLRW